MDYIHESNLLLEFVRFLIEYTHFILYSDKAKICTKLLAFGIVTKSNNLRLIEKPRYIVCANSLQ